MTSIACAGSVALDTTRTPFKTVERVLGGAASYFSLASRFFAQTHVSSIVGEDFPKEYLELLKSNEIHLDDLIVARGKKTFFYDSSFDYDMYHRTTNKTELNVLLEYEPKFGNDAKKCHFAYLATMPPGKQKEAKKEARDAKIVFMDTIEHYIKTEKEELIDAMASVTGCILNDSETRMLTGEHNLVKAGKKIQEMGVPIVIVKKGEHGALLFHEKHVVPFPALPMEEVVDPTGAGDSFAGGFMGTLAKENATKPTLKNLKQAMAYGVVMGSIAVSGYSVESLVRTKHTDIEREYQAYRELLSV